MTSTPAALVEMMSTARPRQATTSLINARDFDDDDDDDDKLNITRIIGVLSARPDDRLSRMG